MFPQAEVKLFCSVVVSICVLSIFLFPAATGPFSAVRGPASDIQSNHHGFFFFAVSMCISDVAPLRLRHDIPGREAWLSFHLNYGRQRSSVLNC
jgi:hypothetical protein